MIDWNLVIRRPALIALGLIVVFSLGFPLTTISLPLTLGYYFFYSTHLVVVVWLLDRRPKLVGWTALAGAAAFSMGVLDALALRSMPQAIAWAALFVLAMGLAAHSLTRFIFEARRVSQEVLLASVALYLMLGSIFIPVYTLIERLAPGSFNLSLPPGSIPNWQDFLYFSFVTLTTAGYGDISPATYLARALAVGEAITGVLYIALLMSRLVGLYAADEAMGQGG